jgi:hypothetical protein
VKLQRFFAPLVLFSLILLILLEVFSLMVEFRLVTLVV